MERRKGGENSPPLAFMMGFTFMDKKGCAELLAALGEESLQAVKDRKEKNEFSSVSWVQGRIVAVEEYADSLLVRVTAALPRCYAGQMERLVQEAALRENGYYHFSAREMVGFSLAEVTIYAIPNARDLIVELEIMFKKLMQIFIIPF